MAEHQETVDGLMHDNMMLHAKVARLEAENEDLRRWKALDKPLTTAMSLANSHLTPMRDKIERLRAEVAERDAAIATLDNQVSALLGPDGPLVKAGAEIERLTAELATARDGLEVMDAAHKAMAKQIAGTARERDEARARIGEAVNTLADPCDACDFEDGEVGALRATINDALRALRSQDND